MEKLNQLAENLFGVNDIDPSKRLANHSPFQIQSTEAGYKLALHLPGIRKGKVDCWINGDELFIKVNNFHRNIILPRALVGLSITRARFNQGHLTLDFGCSYAKTKESN